MNKQEWNEYEAAKLSFSRLRDSLMLAASTPDDQLKALPDCVDKPYELASELCNWTTWAAANSQVLGLDPEQVDRLKRLDGLLASISGPAHGSLWTEQALKTSPEWTRIREAAADALATISWESAW